MVFAVRPLSERLAREREEEREREETRRQAAAFRQWMRLGDETIGEYMALAPNMPTPGQMNPQGLEYERERIRDDSLRPSTWTLPEPTPAPTPTVPSELQLPVVGMSPLEELARGFAPEPPVPFRPDLEAGARGAREFSQSIQGMPLPDVAGLMGLADVAGQMGTTPQALAAQPQPTEFEREALQQRIETASLPALQELAPSPGALRTGAALALTPLAGGPPGANPLERVGDIPFVGPPLQRELEFLTSPAGLVTGAIMPAPMAAGAAGGVGLGAAAGPAVEAGLLPSGTVDVPVLGELGVPEIAQIIGNIAPPALFTAPGRAALQTGRQTLHRTPQEIAETVPEVATRAVPEAAEEVAPVVAREAAPPARAAGEVAEAAPRRATEKEVAEVLTPEELVEFNSINASDRWSARDRRRIAELMETGERRLAPVRPAAEAPDLAPVGGGAPLTRAQVTGRATPAVGAEPSGFVQGMKDALTRSGPGRAAREAGRKANGAVNLANQEVKVWGEDMAELAGRAGIRIVKGAGVEKQSDELVGIIERIWGGIDPATGRTARRQLGAFPERQRPFVEPLYDRVDNLTQQLVAADPDFAKHTIEDYFPHLFKTAKRPGVATGRGGLGTRPGFGRRRELEGGLGDILNDRPDLDLVSWDPIDLVKRHEVAVQNHLAQLEAIRLLKADGAMLTKAKAPSFWRTPDLRGWGMRERLQHWRAPPEVASGLENLFGKTAFDSNGLLKAVKGTRGALFKIKVAGGLFQHIDFSQRALFRGVVEGLREMSPIRRAGKGVPIGGGFKATTPGLPKNMVRSMFSPLRATARSVIPTLDRKISRLTLANPHLRGGYRNGLGAGADPSIGEGAIRGLGGIVPQTVGGKQIPGAKWLQDTVEFMTGGAYETFHKEMLEQGYLVTLQKHLRAGTPLEEAYRLAAEETNVVFSSVPNWQSAVMNPTGKDMLRIGIFSPGELEGLLRMPFQSPASFTGIIGGTVIAAQMLNKLFTGEFLKPEQMLPYELDPDEIERLRKDPRSILSAGVPGVDYRTTFLRPELPWTGPGGRKLYLDLLGQADTVFRVALDPVFALQTRLGQLPRAVLDLEQIRRGEVPAFGERVESPADLAKAAAQQVSPIAVTGLAGTERGRIGATGAGIQSSGLNISAEPLRELLAREAEEKWGRPFNPDVDYEQARQDPDLSPILDELDRRGIEFGAEGATEAAEREAFLGEREQELRLPEKAQAVLGGNIAAVAGFNEAYEDYRSTAADAAARDFFGREPREAETPEGRRYQQYRDISPWDSRFQNPETLEIDWDAYMPVKDAAFARLPPDLQRAIENRTATQDEGANRLARLIRDWRDQLDPYYTEDQGRARTNFRRRNPDTDAILWIVGNTTGVFPGRAQDAAVRLLREAGIRINRNDVARRTGGGGSRPSRPQRPVPVGGR